MVCQSHKYYLNFYSFRECFCLFSADVDPKIPTLFELNIKMFAKDNSEILDNNSEDHSYLRKVAYYKCIQCDGARFTDYLQYKNHVLYVHNLRKYKMMFKCTILSCEATFSSVKQLRKHLLKNRHLS
jgi:hypothetical protein